MGKPKSVRRSPSQLHSQGSCKKSHIKCVAVGDENVGKTSLLVTYTTDTFPGEHVPTVWTCMVSFDSYWTATLHEGKPVTMGLIDTPGQFDMASVRCLSYSNTDVVLACFAVDDPDSLCSVSTKWCPEIRRHCPNVPIILVGTKVDLRTSRVRMYADAYSSCEEQQVLYTHGVMMAREISAERYVECSAKTRQGLGDIFEAVKEMSLTRKPPTTSPVAKKQDFCCKLM